jgi:hypothetical protein
MPPLGLHMTVARELATRIGSSRIDADRGAYYLGATTPDIRVLTRWDRERTHFFNLRDRTEQSGVHRLFEEQPGLQDAVAIDTPTAAFVAGYISHLVLDEEYITQIYRSYFGEGGALGDQLMANVMDRLLQLHLDRQEREDGCAVVEIRDALARTAVDVAVDFIGHDTLLEWRDWQIELISTAPHFEKMMVRHLQAVGIRGEVEIARFFEEHSDELLRDTINRVGEERIRDYLSTAKAKAQRAMTEYLS